jgi:flagellar capping protein FliD
LTGESTNENTADLQLLVSLPPSQVDVGGIRMDVTVTRGIAASLDRTLGSLLDSQFSVMNNANDALDRRIEVIDESIDRLNDRFETREQSLLRRFAEMEAAIGELQSTGDFLNTQLQSLAGL